VVLTSPPRRMTASKPRLYAHHSDVESENETGDTESGADESGNASGDAESGGDESGSLSGGAESGGEDYPDAEWVFHEGLKLILHDVDRCGMCGKFAVHYSQTKIRLHPSYRTAFSARKAAIVQAVQERIDVHRSQLEVFNRTIPHLQRILEEVRQEIRAAGVDLENHRTRLEEVRRELKGARQDRAAARGSTSSQRPRSSRSPSPRPRKVSRHASE
jgi:hypothetical protein